MEKKTHILLFYKYVNIENPTGFAKSHLEECNALGLKGRILVAGEGINGSVAGDFEKTEKYKRLLRQDPRFKDIVFKEDIGVSIPFKKMVIKIKKELVRFEQKVSLDNTGKHLTPKEFLEIYEKNDDVIILDARNDYESRVGKFKNAVTPPIKKFSEFPKVAEMLKDKKDKKIVMYCTGGIRCEKASAYLKENGFEDVSQLSGGILSFGKEFPDTVWEGTCFVFDKRLTSEVNDDVKPITKCEICEIACDLYRNCSNPKCDKYSVICVECEVSYQGCCSEECLEAYKQMVKVKNNLRDGHTIRNKIK
jgi:UPF0176 protein